MSGRAFLRYRQGPAGDRHQDVSVSRHGQATIVGDNPANTEIFTHGEHVYMCRVADPRSLVDAILTLRANRALREKIAWGGYRHSIERYSSARIGATLHDILREAHAAVPGES